MLLDRVILWTNSIFYIVRELLGWMSVMESAAIGDSMESQALGLVAQTKRGNLELVESYAKFRLGSTWC